MATARLIQLIDYNSEAALHSIYYMDNGLLMRTKNYESSNWLAFWAVQSAAQTKSIYVEKKCIKYTAAQWLQIAKTRQN